MSAAPASGHTHAGGAASSVIDAAPLPAEDNAVTALPQAGSANSIDGAPHNDSPGGSSDSPPELDGPVAMDVIHQHRRRNPVKNSRPSESYLQQFSRRSRQKDVPASRGTSTQSSKKRKQKQRERSVSSRPPVANTPPESPSEEDDSSKEDSGIDRPKRGKVHLSDFSWIEKKFVKSARLRRTVSLVTHDPWPDFDTNEEFHKVAFKYARAELKNAVASTNPDEDRVRKFVRVGLLRSYCC